MKLGEVTLSSRKEGGALELGRQAVSNLSPVWPRAGYLTSLSLTFFTWELEMTMSGLRIVEGSCLCHLPAGAKQTSVSFLCSYFTFSKYKRDGNGLKCL